MAELKNTHNGQNEEVLKVKCVDVMQGLNAKSVVFIIAVITVTTVAPMREL